MSQANSSIAPQSTDVNTWYYSVRAKSSAKATQARLSAEQRQAANRRAAELRAQDAILLVGPVESGTMIVIPSWRWNPELVAAIKAVPGWRFEKDRPHTTEIVVHGQTYTPTITMPTWTVPTAPGRIEAIRAVYERVFNHEIAAALASQRLAALGNSTVIRF